MRLTLINPTNLLGEEVKRTLGERRELWEHVRLTTLDSEAGGTVTDVGGAAAIVEPFDADSVSGDDLVILCGEPQAEAAVLRKLAENSTVLLLDTGALTLRGRPVVAGLDLDLDLESERLLLSPEPWAMLLAYLLRPLAGLGLRRAVATVIEPASRHGSEGLNELLEQTRAILTFSNERPASVFGTQMAFNLLPAPPPSPEAIEELGRLIGSAAPLSVGRVQGSVFHGVATKVWVEIEPGRSAEELGAALAKAPLVEAREHATLGPVAAAAATEVLLGVVDGDAAVDGGFWIWAAMDNLTRGAALNAVAIVEALAARPA